MINGTSPVIIFQFGKLIPGLSEALSKVPVISQIPSVVEQPPIPIYLSDSVTGLMIDTQDKNVDIQTDVETKSDGSDPDVKQKGVNSSVRIQIKGKADNVGLILLSALIDMVFDKLSSKEYAISYLNGATTIFRGVLQNYSVNSNADNDMLLVTVELSKGTKTPQKTAEVPTVPSQTGTLPANF